jgi:hypothetical protein
MPNGFPYRNKGKSDYWMQFFPVQTITAIAPSAQVTAALIASDTAYVTVTPSGGAVKLPSAQAGRVITVINNGANLLTVWPFLGDNINNAGTNLILVGGIASGSILLFYSGSIGFWWSK